MQRRDALLRLPWSLQGSLAAPSPKPAAAPDSPVPQQGARRAPPAIDSAVLCLPSVKAA